MLVTIVIDFSDCRSPECFIWSKKLFNAPILGFLIGAFLAFFVYISELFAKPDDTI